MMQKSDDQIVRERWQRVQSVFEQALAKTESDRTAFLDHKCAQDRALRGEVDAMLAADETADQFIEPPACVKTAIPRVEKDQLSPGDRLGPFEIESLIAAGGMGKVYSAIRIDRQYEKRVAIKVIKRGMDTDEVLRRFRAERQTLANLDHPNIGWMLDGGMTGEGLPYIVMELIEGEPIDAYCDAHRLTIDARLQLFRRICAAVEYAHRNLVVHRDIKPANILVTREGVPKLLDFGISKVLEDADSGGSSVVTLEGARPMTPEYASPEQITGRPVTTASDVYALGVVLYELLSGHKPYQWDTRSSLEMQRVICDVPPEPPSTVFRRSVEGHRGDSDDSQPSRSPETVSHRRAEQPRRLHKKLAGDLDNIVLTALRKEPEARYASVGAFAEDVARYLDGLPVAARPTTMRYRAGKFIRRHRALTALAVALIITLSAGVVGVALTARAALLAADDARVEADKAREISAFVRNMLASVRPEMAGQDVTVRTVLDEAAARIDSDLSGHPEVEAQVRTTIGQTYESLGYYTDAEPHLRAALDLRIAIEPPDPALIAQSRVNLAAVQIARSEYDLAEALLDDALGFYMAPAPVRSRPMARALEMSSTLSLRLGRFDAAVEFAQDALDALESASGTDELDIAHGWYRLGAALHAAGKYDAADAAYRTAVDMKRSILGSDDPRIAGDLTDWGSVLLLMDRSDEALQLIREAVDIRRTRLGDDHPLLSESLTRLGWVLVQLHQLEEAEKCFIEAVRIDRERLGDDHPALATPFNQLGITTSMHDSPDWNSVEELHQAALEIVENKFGRDHPSVADTLHLLGRIRQVRGDLDGAVEFFRQSLEIKRRVLGPAHPSIQRTLGHLGAVYTRHRKYDVALEFREQQLQLARQSLPPGHHDIGTALYQVALIHRWSGDYEAALPVIRECYDIWTRTQPDNLYHRGQLSLGIGECLLFTGDIESAESLLLEAHELLIEHGGRDHYNKRISAQRLMDLYERTGDVDRVEHYRQVYDSIEKNRSN